MSGWRLRRLSPSAEETERIGERLGEVLRPGDVVVLEGALGSGKTCLVRGLARGLGCDPGVRVSSPSYVLRQDYPGHTPLVHVDLYRVGRDAIAELALEEAESSVIAIEWGSEVAPYSGSRLLKVSLSELDLDRREVLIELVAGEVGELSRLG